MGWANSHTAFEHAAGWVSGAFATPSTSTLRPPSASNVAQLRPTPVSRRAADEPQREVSVSGVGQARDLPSYCRPPFAVTPDHKQVPLAPSARTNGKPDPGYASPTERALAIASHVREGTEPTLPVGPGHRGHSRSPCCMRCKAHREHTCRRRIDRGSTHGHDQSLLLCRFSPRRPSTHALRELPRPAHVTAHSVAPSDYVLDTAGAPAQVGRTT